MEAALKEENYPLLTPPSWWRGAAAFNAKLSTLQCIVFVQPRGDLGNGGGMGQVHLNGSIYRWQHCLAVSGTKSKGLRTLVLHGSCQMKTMPSIGAVCGGLINLIDTDATDWHCCTHESKLHKSKLATNSIAMLNTICRYPYERCQ